MIAINLRLSESHLQYIGNHLVSISFARMPFSLLLQQYGSQFKPVSW